MDRSTERKPVAILHSEFNEQLGQLSADSRWLSYTSDESGQREVYGAAVSACRVAAENLHRGW